MAHQVDWNKTILEAFKEEAMLSEEECFIMETRMKGWTVVQQSMHLHKSPSTIHSMISTLKKKYDVAQKARPDILPERKVSVKEMYLDSH